MFANLLIANNVIRILIDTLCRKTLRTIGHGAACHASVGQTLFWTSFSQRGSSSMLSAARSRREDRFDGEFSVRQPSCRHKRGLLLGSSSGQRAYRCMHAERIAVEHVYIFVATVRCRRFSV